MSARSERVTRDALVIIARGNGAATGPAAEWVLADSARVALVADSVGADEWYLFDDGRPARTLVDRVATLLVLLAIRKDTAATLAAIDSENGGES